MPAMKPPFAGVLVQVDDAHVERYLELGYQLEEKPKRPAAKQTAKK